MMLVRAILFVTTAAAAISCGPTSSPTSPDLPGGKHEASNPPNLRLLEQGREASTESVASLLETLAARSGASERAEAARALGIAAAMGADGAPIAKGLGAAIDAEPDDPTTAALLWALGRAGGEESVDRIAAHLAPNETAAVVAAAALALGVMGRREVPLTAKARAALVRRSSSEDEVIRYAVAYGLAREHEPPVDAAVLRTLEGLALDAAAPIRSVALTGLGRRRRGAERLASALGDKDWRVGVAAIVGLLSVGGESSYRAIEEWSRASKKGPSYHPRRVALAGLADVADVSSAPRTASTYIARLGGKSGLSIDDGQILCLALAISQRAGGDPAALASCAGISVPAWWRASVRAPALAKTSSIPARERVRLLTEMARDTDARLRAAAIAPLASLAIGSERPAVLQVLAETINDDSAAVAGSTADELSALALRDEESVEIYRALIARAERELESDGELGLTLVAAIGKSQIKAGTAACNSAAAHRNRTVRAAGRGCLEALEAPMPEAAPLVRAPLPTVPPRVARWVIQTSRGKIVIVLDPVTAPRHVAAVTKLTEAKFYDGLTFHRVVPDFVIQGGDPDGTGWGGPDFAIPAEPSALPFDRGAVGIADAGPDTGGSQWFVMHSRAPHLEGRYTRIGEVVSGMEIVDAITVGDRIESARIEVK